MLHINRRSLSYLKLYLCKNQNRNQEEDRLQIVVNVGLIFFLIPPLQHDCFIYNAALLMRVVKSSGFIKSKKVLFRNRGRIRKAMFDFCIVFPFKLSGSVGCKIVDNGLFQNYLHTFICLAKMHELRNHICLNRYTDLTRIEQIFSLLSGPIYRVLLDSNFTQQRLKQR